jgi:tetratricopeptide (TPR) repeat protein
MGTDANRDSELGSLAQLLRKIAATSANAPALAPGCVIARRYTVRRLLGRGGMGAVYEVHDLELDEAVALKLLHRELGCDAGYQQRLRAEVRLARRVSHPNVCRVHDLGLDGEQLFVTMELVRGRSLRQLLRTRDAAALPTLAESIDVVVQLATALGAAHRAGVLHRDVKPDNVMIDGSRAVLTDFGVASLAHDKEHVVAGTPSYIAPEVLRGEPFDHRADVYSTAVVAYELATGAPPFPARTLEEAAVLAARPPPPPPLPATFGTPALRLALDDVFARALAPQPASRIPSMDRLAEAIAHAARPGGAHLVTARATQPPASSSTTSRRSEVRVATALVYRADELEAGTGEDLERIVVDAGGTPVTTSALEVTALFGVPVALGDDAERAARAARALIERRGGRAGLDTVRVMLRPSAMALATRETFASASSLVDAAGAGEILASAITARQLAARFEIAGVEVGGSSARRIIGARPPVPRADAATFRPRELAALVSVAEDCFTHRRPRHAEVRGAAGFGKTQLRDALIARIRERRDVDWLIARADLHGSTAPLGLLHAAHADWYARVERAGLGDCDAAFAAARTWLEARSERQPVAVVFEDMQWADELTRAFVEQLAASLGDVPVLVVTFVRARDDEPAPPPRAKIDVLSLGALDGATASALVRSLAPGATREAIDDVVARAGGHPFFLEELARSLGEHGPAHAAATPLPPTIEAIVQARLDRLPPAARELIAAAAVTGSTFWRDALSDVTGQGSEAIDAGLAELERRAMVVPATEGDTLGAAGDRYRFVNELVRDVAFARLAPRERRGVHAAVAAWLLDRFPSLGALDRGGRSDLPIEIVSAFAHHLEEAGEPARAAVAYRVAGGRQLESAMYREAARSLRRAATLLPAIDAELASQLGDAVLLVDSIDEAEAWYARAFAATPDDDGAGRALLWHKLGTAASRRADHTRALDCFERGLAVAAPDGTHLASWALRDPRTAALLFGSLGWVAGYLAGDNQRGLAACERAVELLDGTPYRRELAHALSRLGATYMRASRFRDQLACNRRNLEIGIEIADLMMQLTARVNLGVVHGVLGEIDDAIYHTEIARDLATRSGARNVVGLIESNLAGFYLECGRLDDAEHCLDEALALSERAGRRTGLTETYGFAARLRAAKGDLAGAARWAQLALELAQHLELKLDESIALRLLAQLRARTGDRDGALAAIATAAARGAGLDPFESARTEAARARVLRRLGGDDDAAAAASAAEARAVALADLTRLGARRELAVLDELDEVR